MIRNLEKGLYREPGKRLYLKAFRGKTTSKIGPRDFYKGRGAPSLGRITSKGKFIYDPKKLPVFVVPDLTDFPLKPYVSYSTPKVKVAPPTVPELNLKESEVDILDIVAPQHKKRREQKRKELFGEVDQQQQQETEKPDIEVVFQR
eukprot:TRINITY_DN11188_c0_g1_i1.p1 TRINITY_DN11188_c0_g1~~TRINITY_DN11188_c0_g1_i1.p1  ORF type:complete len:146 (+),score=45.73 TRINITY_DN11188_c0_g1_i1:47-484(+)